MNSFQFRAGHHTKIVPVSGMIGFLLIIGAIGLQAGNASLMTSPDGRINA